ncbi:hypothetical protein BDW69DRAFT_163720 [Aspergillus filifer]
MQGPVITAKSWRNSQLKAQRSSIPQVLLLRYDHNKVHHDYLKLQNRLTIPTDCQEYLPGVKAVKYELQSIIFHFYEDLQSGNSKERNDIRVFESGFDICAVKELNNGRWALIRSDSVESDLTLPRLLQIMSKVGNKHLTNGLAYRRMPLTGPPDDLAGLNLLVKQTIQVRDGLEFTFNKLVYLPPDIKQLIDLKGQQKKHHGHIKVMISSASTNETLEGETKIMLGKRKADRGNPASAATSKRQRVTASEQSGGSKSTTKTPAVAGPSKTTKAKKLALKAAGSDAAESSWEAQKRIAKTKALKNTTRDSSQIRAEASNKAKEAPSKRKRADDPAPAGSSPEREKAGESASDENEDTCSKKAITSTSEKADSGAKATGDSSSEAV